MPVSYKLLFAEEEPQAIGVDMTRECIEVRAQVGGYFSLPQCPPLLPFPPLGLVINRCIARQHTPGERLDCPCPSMHGAPYRCTSWQATLYLMHRWWRAYGIAAIDSA